MTISLANSRFTELIKEDAAHVFKAIALGEQPCPLFEGRHNWKKTHSLFMPTVTYEKCACGAKR